MNHLRFVLLAGGLPAAALVGASLWALSDGDIANAQTPDATAMDEAKAAPKNYLVRYEDDHLRLVEVVVRPGETVPMHVNPYPSIVVNDGAVPATLVEKYRDAASTRNGQGAGHGGAPPGMSFPVCTSTAERAPYSITNSDTFPFHAYRIEFKRIDGDKIKTDWKTTYPWMLNPEPKVANLPMDTVRKEKPFSKEWPFPIAYDSYKAAPNNHQLRYEDDHVRFLEVTIRPGERENTHGHPYTSTFARDVGGGMTGGGTQAGTPNKQAPQLLPEPGLHRNPDGTIPVAMGDLPLQPGNPMNNPSAANAPPPAGMQWPTCSTMSPQAPHAAYQGQDYPSHFYRIEFKRVDGDDFKTNWRQWYPAMAAN